MEHGSAARPFYILSLDGGGVRGILPARILQEIENISGKPVSQLFDLIVGTSTGGLLTLALTCPNKDHQPKFSAKQILDLYLHHSKDIFTKSFLHSFMSGFGLWNAKYDRKNYDAILLELLEENYLSEVLAPVAIVCYSLMQAAPHIFTSSQAKLGVEDCYLRDVAAATSAAPTYFDPKIFYDRSGQKHIEVDGGIFANNPESIGIVEAYGLCPNLKKENIHILSIGTGSPKLTKTADELTHSGVIGWIMKANLIDMMMNADSDWYSTEASMLYPTTHRLQIALSDNLTSMDNTHPDNLAALLEAAENYLDSNHTLLHQIVEGLLPTTNPNLKTA